MTPIEIFDKIEAMILEEPKRIRMENFICRPCRLSEDRLPPCGTVACIGGWAVAIALDKRGEDLWQASEDAEEEARELLQLTYDEAQRLFYEFPPGPLGTTAYAEAVVVHMEEFRKSVPHLRRKES